MLTLTLTGNTYGIKDTLKGLGFRWNPDRKGWYITSDSKAELDDYASRWASEGVNAEMTEAQPEKHYMVKEDWIFNLESMHDKTWCLIYDMRENKITAPFEVAGKKINSEDDLFDLMDEASRLECKAKSNRGVTGREYGRIKALVQWRVMARYTACMAAGMNEADAGRCFEDM